MVTLDQLELQLAAKQAELEGINAALAREQERVSTARRFSPGLLDQNARKQKPIVQSQITALQNKIDEMKANIAEKAVLESEPEIKDEQEQKGINPLIILGGIALLFLI